MVIIASAKDDYHVVFSWNELFNSSLGEGVLIIYEKNGQALDNRTGRIALISSQDHLTGPRFVKWLYQIKVVQLKDLTE